MKVKVSRYTVHVIFADEAQLISSDFFNTNIAPMTTRTGGITVIQGTSLPNAEQLLYAAYRQKSIKQSNRILLTALDVYSSIALRSKEEAHVYWNKYSKAAMDYGVYSDYIQSQYMVSFDIRGDLWLSMERLQQDNTFNIEQFGINNIIPKIPQHKHIYRVGSFDSASKNDFAAFVAGIIAVEKESDGANSYSAYATDFLIVNDKEKQLNQVINPEVMSLRVANQCIALDLDYLIYDSTGAQRDRAFYVARELRKRNHKCMVIPLNYSTKSKTTMFGTVEGMFETSKISLPKNELIPHNKAYKELIEEMRIFKKIVEKGGIKYQAPQSANLHDDMVCALVQLAYLPYYLDYAMRNRIKSEFGGEYEYPICWKEPNGQQAPKRTITHYR